MPLSKSDIARKACSIIDITNGLLPGTTDITDWSDERIFDEVYKSARAIISLQWNVVAALSIMLISGRYTHQKLNKERFAGDRPLFPIGEYVYCASQFENIMQGGVIDFTAPPEYHAAAYKSGTNKDAELSVKERSMLLAQALANNLTTQRLKALINNLIAFKELGDENIVASLFDEIIAERKNFEINNEDMEDDQ